MIISEKKNIERKFFKELRKKNSLIEMRNVGINVKKYVDSIFNKGLENKYIGIYWPLENEIDLRGLRDRYLLALPRCKKNKKLLFCAWDNKQLSRDSQGIKAPQCSNQLSYEKISMIFIPCLAIDKNLIRLGYGGGYFDKLRLDKNWRAIPCIGILNSNCVSHKLLSKADWDIPLSGYITEKEILV